MRKSLVILIFISLTSLFLNLYKKDSTPPGFNADEAAFGYNAYSISKTARDEYGTLLPLRLKSFGDYKMPLYSYLAAPFVGFMGLSETSARMPNTILVVLLPFALYALVKELFDKENPALIASALGGLSWGLLSISRQAHEAYLAVFLTTITLLMFIKLTKKATPLRLSLFLLCNLALLFSYQSGRIFSVGFFILSFFYFWRKKGGKQILLFFLGLLLLFGVTDLIYQPKRVGNLLFFNTPGFSMKINELRGEGGSRLVYNKLTTAKRDFYNSYAKYFSPEFLFISGDENPRFGFLDMGPITLIEYVFLFIGLYYLFKKKERYRYVLLALLLISPLPAALSWAGISLTRSLFFLIPIYIIVAYGMYQLFKAIPNNFKYLLLAYLIVAELSLLFYTWDFYLNHYPKRALVQKAWEVGNKELASFVKNNYDNYDHFYLTRKNGQPYIFLLFYMQYPPEKYQKEALLSAPDQYGFGQVEHFDKFIFSTNFDPKDKGSVVIGYPEDFDGRQIDKSKIKKITNNNREVFWIHEIK